MTISITVGGKPIAHKDIRVDHAVSGAASASFSFESGTTMRTGDIVEVNWGGKVGFRGIVKSMTLTSSGGEAFAVDLATLAPIVYPAAAKAPAPQFVYGDIIHTENAPSQREMVITVEKRYINTIVLDREEPGIFGASTGMSIESAVKVTE